MVDLNTTEYAKNEVSFEHHVVEHKNYDLMQKGKCDDLLGSLHIRIGYRDNNRTACIVHGAGVAFEPAVVVEFAPASDSVGFGCETNYCPVGVAAK